MADILIKKSNDDVPVYEIFRVTKVGRKAITEHVITTNDLVLVARYLREW